jgi:thymidylate synthase
MKELQRIIVFQQNGSGEGKVKAITKYAPDRIKLEIVSIDGPLPTVIDDSSGFLPEKLDADMVLDFLKHPDLSHDLGLLGQKCGVPVVSSGKKHRIEGVFTPPT